jgi:hypothetical protein
VTRRVDLQDGQWADLVERLNHAQRQRIRFAGRDGLDNVSEGIAAMLTGWHVLDVDGVVIPVPAERPVGGFPSAVLDTFPMEVVDDIGLVVAKIVGGEPVPKAGAGTSPGSARQASRPASMNGSPTSTSSPTTRAGHGRTSSPPLPT